MRYLVAGIQLSLALLTATGHAQPTLPAANAAKPAEELECRVLTGRITDPFAYPLTGATIMLRSPGKGLSPEAFGTNSEGHYIITSKLPIPRNTIMEVTAVGYTTLELALTNCRPLDLTLTPLEAGYKPKSRGKKLPNSSRVR